MNDVADYQRAEIERALKDHPERHHLTLKIQGDEGASKWLNVTPQQTRVIRELLAGDLLEVLAEALGDALAYRCDEEDREVAARYRALAEAVQVEPFPA